MAYIRSATVPNFKKLEGPSTDTGYSHPAVSRKGGMPLAFQVTSPFNNRMALLPHALVMHVNPSSFAENHNKKIERIQTRGGFVEQHWGDDLSEISCDGSTGAFVNLYTGTSSLVRQKTIAWDRYRDLYDLYRNNGSIYDPFGNIVLQGQIQLLYDRGAFIGTFRSFDVEETSESPFAFKLSWSFKVEYIIVQVPYGLPKYDAKNGLRRDFTPNGYVAPQFQTINAASSTSDSIATEGQVPLPPAATPTEPVAPSPTGNVVVLPTTVI